MNEKSKREQAYKAAGALWGGMTGGWDEPILARGMVALVDLIIDAAKEELRAEMDAIDEELLREMHRRHGEPGTGDGEDRP